MPDGVAGFCIISPNATAGKFTRWQNCRRFKSQTFLKCNPVALKRNSFSTFAVMKRKFAIFNLALMAVVLFTTAYQSFHAFSHRHFAGQDSHHHEITKAAKQFAADDDSQDDEDCSVCDFHFDYFVAPQEFCLTLEFPFKPIPYTFSATESNTFFAGSLFALRAPPVV
jgi:hypothetical protein